MIVFLYRAGAADPLRRLRPSPFFRVFPACSRAAARLLPAGRHGMAAATHA
ncbi:MULTISPECIES: hypothetical protein [unclassified Achromobacter]|uniref:hypothetical protein n=1 Tax=unclassified Achromobacter TaxID=2626865 RepID=UPI0012EBFF7A|nr:MULTISPECIES: hypothetical protein [unclassified Achromobacter]